MIKFYRYVDSHYAHYTKPMKLVYELVKETPCGYYIKPYSEIVGLHPDECKKWIKKRAIRSFACLTRKKAMESYEARKKKQIIILEHQLKRAKMALREIKIMSGRFV